MSRILKDRGLSQTYLGSIVITCAAVDDVTACCILALVITIVNASGVAVSLATVLFTLLFVTTFISGPLLWLVRTEQRATEVAEAVLSFSRS